MCSLHLTLHAFVLNILCMAPEQNKNALSPIDSLAFDELRQMLSTELSKREGYAVDYSPSQLNNLLAKNMDLWSWHVVTPKVRFRVCTKQQAETLLARIRLNKRTKKYQIQNYRQNDIQYRIAWRARFLLDATKHPHIPLRTIDVLTFIETYIYEGYTNPQLQKLLEKQHQQSPFPTLVNPRTGAVKRFYKGTRLDEIFAKVLQIRETRPVLAESFWFALSISPRGNKIPLFCGTITDGRIFNPTQITKYMWIEDENTLCFGDMRHERNIETGLLHLKSYVKEKFVPIAQNQIDCVNTIIRRIESFVLAWRYLFSLFSAPDDIDNLTWERHKSFVIPFYSPITLADNSESINPTLYDFAELSTISPNQISARPEGARTRTQIKYDILRQVEYVKKREQEIADSLALLEQADAEQAKPQKTEADFAREWEAAERLSTEEDVNE